MPLKRRGRDTEATLSLIFGDAYRPTGKRSELTRHLERMNGEVLLGQDSFERKLRYLLWIN